MINEFLKRRLNDGTFKTEKNSHTSKFSHNTIQQADLCNKKWRIFTVNLQQMFFFPEFIQREAVLQSLADRKGAYSKRRLFEWRRQFHDLRYLKRQLRPLYKRFFDIGV